MQGTQVWSLVREDSTYRGATKPEGHNYWVHALEPVVHRRSEPTEEPLRHKEEEEQPLATTTESLRKKQWRPSTARNK